jgi:hypothetical protein
MMIVVMLLRDVIVSLSMLGCAVIAFLPRTLV